MTRHQRLTVLQPIFRNEKMSGGLSAGNSPVGYARAYGGIISPNGPTNVEHTYSSSGSFTLMAPGTLNVVYTITGSASFDGNTSSGSMAVTSTIAVTAPAGTVVVSYNPSTDWTPA